ncbi:hypothetical protein [Winogradskyella sp.]|uniref:hypothetical protein n=1 Tax=Winogradskyella sp. TaxID=1883156 RepID=UPI0025F2AC09|nr:hypothetical protein [Winogradskyella sp.]
MNTIIIKTLNLFYILAIFLLIASIIRTLIYLLIGIPNERIFRTGLILFWAIAIGVILLRQIVQRKHKTL